MNVTTFMSTIPYTLKIMDTGDYFILHMAVYNNVDYLMELLYKGMDISLDILDASLLVNHQEYLFLLETCSRLIPNEFKNLEDLKKDLENILSFYKIKQSYIRMNMNLNNQIIDSKVSANKPEADSFYPGYGGPEWSTYSNDLSIFIDNEPSLTSCAYQLSYSPVLSDETAPFDNEEEYLLFYHSDFHISVLLSRKEMPNTFYIPDLLKHIPEFKWVDSFKFSENTHIQSMKNLFDKKYYEDEECLKEKIKSFKHLYNIESKSSGSIHSLPEKERFNVILEHKFIVDKDPAHRMKASDLYKQFTSLMNVPESTLLFQRRLQGYFIESGLQKKRYTDGYYYYGIQANPTVVTLHDLWKKYMKSKNPMKPSPCILTRKTDTLSDLLVPIHEC